MRNLILFQNHIQNLIKTTKPLGFYIDEFSKLIVILDSNLVISIFSYEDKDSFSNFSLKHSIELDSVLDFKILEELMEQGDDFEKSFVKLILFKSEEDSIHLVLQNGKYIKIILNGAAKITNLLNYDNKNDNAASNIKILSVEISPNLEHIVVISSNFKIMLFNYDFEFLNICDLDDSDLSDSSKDAECQEAAVSWRGDSLFFAVLYSINEGKKCLVRDTKLNVFKGPARADNKVVFSMAENPVKSIYKNIILNRFK